MRRVHKVTTALFLSGVLLGGIGTGIALVEYSSLTYGGEHLIGEEYLVTKNLDYEFEQDGRILILPRRYYMGRMRALRVETDDTVPVGTVRYEVTYNEKRLEPQLTFEPWEEEEETLEAEEESRMSQTEGEEGTDTDTSSVSEEEETVYAGYLYLSACEFERGFAVFMENKDRFLEELKEKKISTYQEAYITDIKVKVNPGTRPFVEAREGWN
ncbi:MAG: hypothetical protein HFG75_09980 [Hungatella sp.]|nr:hypothetical protein [Hungatella sp.]